MPTTMRDKPQVTQKSKDQWDRNLRPDSMGGQNVGVESEEAERRARSAYDVKRAHATLRQFSDDELKQIPVLEEGVRLRQGASYFDLEGGEFTASGDMRVGLNQNLIPKDRVHYDLWNKLVGAPHAKRGDLTRARETV